MVISQTDMFYCITIWWSLKPYFTVSLHGDLSRDMFYCIPTWWSLKRHVLLYHHMVISQETCFTVSPQGDLSQDMFYCVTTWSSLPRHVLLYHHMVISQETCFTVSPHGNLSRDNFHCITTQWFFNTCYTLSQHETFHLHSSWSYHQKSQLIVAQLYLQCYQNWFLYICSSLAHHIHHKGQYYRNQYNSKINEFLFNNNSNQFMSGSIQFLIQTLFYLVHQKIFISDFNTEE